MSQYEKPNPELGYEPANQGFDPTAESRGERSPEQIEQDIERTRDRMSRNIDELGDRLNPQNLKEEAKTAARRTGSRLVEVIRDNPLPVIAVGAGVTWLLTQRSRNEISGDRMARYAYTGPERRQGTWRGGIKARARDIKEGVGETASTVAERAGELKDRASELGGEARWQTRRLRTRLEETADESPLVLAIGAAVVGLALGLLLPGTERENELMGPARDDLVDRAESTVERVKDAAVEAGQDVKETVRSEIQNHEPEIKQAVRETRDSIKEQVKESARRVKSEAKNAASKQSGGNA